MVKDRQKQQNTTLTSRRSPQDAKQRMIDDVIENFDFVKCHSAMKALGWTWVGRGIPTIDDLKESAITRIEQAIKGALDKDNRLSHHSYYFSSSGGLKASVWKNRYGHLEAIKLEFVLTEWDSDGDE